MEAAKWKENSFVTLTYSEKHLPIVTGSSGQISSLRRTDLQNWLKRVRFAYAVKLRFFGVGEYGDVSGRPHYHIALFGYKGCVRGDSRFGKQPCGCASCELLRATWKLGLVHQGRIERKSAQYLAGYTIKGMTRESDVRLDSREPEFARMSLRPGIGADAMVDVASTLKAISYGGDDVPSSLRHGSRELPLGRYLVRRLRVLMGRDPGSPGYDDEEMQRLRVLAQAYSDKSVYAEGSFNQEVFKKLLVESKTPQVNAMIGRRKIYERGKK